MSLTDNDIAHLERCVELAREALENGDEPFGSILVDADGATLFEDRNRVKDGDATRHPEFAIAAWAVDNIPPVRRVRTTVYTSGEHCPMCAAAHAWVGLGRIVFATSSQQLSRWRELMPRASVRRTQHQTGPSRRSRSSTPIPSTS